MLLLMFILDNFRSGSRRFILGVLSLKIRSHAGKFRVNRVSSNRLLSLWCGIAFHAAAIVSPGSMSVLLCIPACLHDV